MTGTATSRSDRVRGPACEEVVVYVSVPASAADVGSSTASTVVGRVRGRFGAYVLPFIVGAAAAVGSPIPAITRRFYSAGEVSTSQIGSAFWLLDEFAYTEEAATMEQVRALNALLALPAAEGFRLDLTD